MKRFLALFSSVAFCLCSISCAYAVEVNGSASAAQVQEDTEWFCEEHQQPLIPEEDLPDGYTQFCPDCMAQNSIMVMAAGDLETGAIPVSSVSWAVPGDNLWHAAAAVLGPGNVVAYYIDRDWSSTANSVDVRIVFRNDVSFSPPAASSPYPFFNLNVGVYNEEYVRTWYFQSKSGTPMGQSVYVLCSLDGSTYSSLTSFSSTTTPTSSNLSTYRLSGKYFVDPVSPQNQVFYNFKFGNDFVIPRGCAFYVSDFGLSFNSPDSVEPGQPGTLPDDSISQSWLGGLFDTIFGGIQEIVSGIENLPQSIASGLQSLFDGVTNAVNSIGTAITGAVDAASSAISSAVDSASSAITGIIGQQWNDQSGHNDEIDQAVSDLESQDQQMGQVEDQYLDDFHEQQSSMAGTVSTFQWPSGITSAMAWITIQMNSIWSGLGGNVQMLFTFSMILGLSLIFLGRWRA